MKPPLLENLRTESLSCIIHQANIADCVIVLCNFLPLEISPLNEWSFDSNVVFPCKTLTFTQKYICIKIKSITLVVYKNINCFVDKLLAMALVTSYINCSIIIIIIIITIIMITTTIIIILINNDKIISLNKGIKTQFLFNISNELFCFSNKLLQITASIIKLYSHL